MSHVNCGVTFCPTSGIALASEANHERFAWELTCMHRCLRVVEVVLCALGNRLPREGEHHFAEGVRLVAVSYAKLLVRRSTLQSHQRNTRSATYYHLLHPVRQREEGFVLGDRPPAQELQHYASCVPISTETHYSHSHLHSLQLLQAGPNFQRRSCP